MLSTASAWLEALEKQLGSGSLASSAELAPAIHDGIGPQPLGQAGGVGAGGRLAGREERAQRRPQIDARSARALGRAVSRALHVLPVRSSVPVNGPLSAVACSAIARVRYGTAD